MPAHDAASELHRSARRRYGWRPLPAEIPAGEFEQIEAQVTGTEERGLLEAWYRLDENAVPHVYCLQPRRLEIPETASREAREQAQDAEADEWTAIESRLRRILLDAVAALGLQEDARLKYEASATEQEIVRGALRVPDARRARVLLLSHAHDLRRRSTRRAGTRGWQRARLHRPDRGGWPVRSRHGALTSGWPGSRRKSSARCWETTSTTTRLRGRDDGVGEDHLGSLPESLDDCLELLDDPAARGTLCLDVWRSLATTILRQLEQVERIDPVYAEIWSHEEFGRERSRHFTGREQPLARDRELPGRERPRRVRDPRRAGLGQVGADRAGGGGGARRSPAGGDARAFHRRHVRPPRTAVRCLTRCVARSRAPTQADEADVPSEYNDLAVELGKRMELASADRPLVLFVDALDQLSGVARGLSWLPGSLPEHVRVVVSTLPGDCEQALRAKHPAPELVPLEAMSPEEGQELLARWLEQAGRTLQEHQEQEVLGKFASEGLPLYLRLAFEEARLWRSYAQPEETVLSEGIPALIRENLFARLAQPANHGRVMVAHSLGYLAASRYGLSEDEIVDVLSLDGQVKQDFREHARRSPEIDRLPIVVWSRLYFDLAPYLSERTAEGTTLLAFYHNQLRDAASAAVPGRRARAKTPHRPRRLLPRPLGPTRRPHLDGWHTRAA